MIKTITAESVTQGHPDKLADLIADSILDACLEKDSDAHVACEVLLTGGIVTLAGEISCKEEIDYVSIARAVIESVGYDTSKLHIANLIQKQSADIAQAVKGGDEQGAGDQGVVYGYATNETFEMMPLAVQLAHNLTNCLTCCLGSKSIKGLKPDGKALVSVEYEDGVFKRISSIVVSAQHEGNVDIEVFKKCILDNVVSYVFSDYDLSSSEILINPSGRFVLGGFEADTGLTGRKLMVDSYGGIAHHGGGAYSGKDASKVDRSGAYMARYVAANIVAAGLAQKCEVAISYAIGMAEPTGVDIYTFGTGKIPDDEIKKAVLPLFDLRPSAIINAFDLKKPQYAKTAVGGHFGREFPWDKTDKADEIKVLCNLR